MQRDPRRKRYRGEFPVDLLRPNAGDSGPNPKTFDTHEFLPEDGRSLGAHPPPNPALLSTTQSRAVHAGWSRQHPVRGEVERVDREWEVPTGYPGNNSHPPPR